MSTPVISDRNRVVAAAIARWSALALEQDWPGQWVEGAIFPREMVYFLARCEAAAVTRVIESGRQDGYSTMILGEFSDRTGVRIISLDYEEDAARSNAARARLARYRRVECVKGDAFLIFGKLLSQDASASTALLIDGPKAFPAMTISFAGAGISAVDLIAHHNLVPGARDRQHFESFAEGAVFYEDEQEMFGAEWRALTEREIAAATKAGAARSLGDSSLGVLDVGQSNRNALAAKWNKGYRLFQPAIVRLAWRRRMSHPVGSLYSWSERTRIYAKLPGRLWKKLSSFRSQG